VAGSFSAFLVNDTICLVLTPLVLDLVTRLKRDPVPYLLAIPMASNIGSTATITGNPQNMIVGSLAHISYGTFAAALWPNAAVGVILTALLIALVYRRDFLTSKRLPPIVAKPARYHRPLVIKSVLVTIGMMILFFSANRSQEFAARSPTCWRRNPAYWRQGNRNRQASAAIAGAA
jgi:Na+/H+ antiporter NhaD/arsenite permease-like protein